MVTIFAVTGTTGAGKDTLVDNAMDAMRAQGFTPYKISFSDQLREICTGIFPWLPNTTDQSVKNVPFVHDHNPKGFTPRQVWKDVATVIRNIQDNVLACRAGCEIDKIMIKENRTAVIFIPDLRSDPEYKVLRDLIPRKVKVHFVRVLDPQVNEDNCEPIDKPTWNFSTELDITNNKDKRALQEFNEFVQSKLEIKL